MSPTPSSTRVSARKPARRVLRHRGAVAGGIVIGAYLAMAALGGWRTPHDSPRGRLVERLQPPSPAHPLGVDELGRDVLSRVIAGARISLVVQGAAVGLALAAGLVLGGVAGYGGRWADEVISRALDVLLAFPGI